MACNHRYMATEARIPADATATKVCVVGGGTSGIQAVAQLAMNSNRQIFWFDAGNFQQGLMESCREVPANTKLEKHLNLWKRQEFLHWQSLHQPLADAIASLHLKTYQIPDLDRFDPSEGWLMLGDILEVFAQVQEALRLHAPNVSFIADTVESMTRRNAQWHLAAGMGSLTVDAVVLSPGSRPRKFVQHHNDIPLLAALTFSHFRHSVEEQGLKSVAVLGNSHSAALVLKNLVELGVPRVICVARRPMRHAEWDAELNDYRFSMSGLKGVASAFARQHGLDQEWQGGRPELSSGNVEQWSWRDVESGRLAECDAIVQATGWDPAPVPDLVLSDRRTAWSVSEASRDLDTYQLQLQGFTLENMYGTGIAFPEEPGKIKSSPEERGVGFPFASYAVSTCLKTLESKSL